MRYTIPNLVFDRPIHFAGIKGSGMSGLARIVLAMGYPVVGTDPNAGPADLNGEAKIYPEQDGRHIADETQLVVASAALATDHPELTAAAGRGIPIVSYAQMLGEVMARRFGIAVAGTHGKTTTSAMIVSALAALNESPGYVIGGALSEGDNSAAEGSSNYFVAEACEYNKSFLNLRPRMAVITNIELDHLDIYENLLEIEHAFEEFVGLLPDNGVLIYSYDCPVSRRLFAKKPDKSLSYGFGEGADLRAIDFKSSARGVEFNVATSQGTIAFVRLSSPGRHNASNALAAFAVCRALGKSPGESADAVGKFQGVGRRFQIRGEKRGVLVVDDYAHHPTEIRALIDGARGRFPGKRLVVVFQPHQRSRTEAFFDQFASALSGADRVVITDVFSAREGAGAEDRSLSGRLARAVGDLHTASSHLSVAAVKEQLNSFTQAGDVLLVVGAGDINQVSDHLFQS